MQMVHALAERPETSIPQACSDWAEAKAAYRFLANPRVSATALRDAHHTSTLGRVREEETVLVVQDTTTLDFTTHRSVRGLGPLDHSWCQGLKVHSALAVSVRGVPLGLLHQKVWAREGPVGKRHTRRERVTKDKESYRWIEGLEEVQRKLPAGVRAVVVTDREGDIYDLLARPRRPGVDLLVRAAHNRRVSHPEKYLWDAVGSTEPVGTMEVDVPRGARRPPRRAELTLRVSRLGVHPPRYRKHEPGLETVFVNAVLAQEENPPPGQEAIGWLLLTTLPVTEAHEAQRCVEYYARRWLVERYHYVLKSGCQVEELQLETAERLERALALYCIVAWRLLWVTYEARVHPTDPCTKVLAPEEWQALYRVIHPARRLPRHPPPLRDAVRWIGKLGGFLGRAGDREPGVKALWRGFFRLHDFTAALRALQVRCPGVVGNA
jgi:hypothetical protein